MNINTATNQKAIGKVTITLAPITFEFEVVKHEGKEGLWVNHMPEICEKLKQHNYEGDMAKIMQTLYIYLKFELIRFLNANCYDVEIIVSRPAEKSLQLMCSVIDMGEVIEYDFDKAYKVVNKSSTFRLKYLTACDIDFNAEPLSISELKERGVL